MDSLHVHRISKLEIRIKIYKLEYLALIVGMEMEDKEQMVLEAMKKAGKPVRPGDLAKIVNLPKDEVSKIIRNLKKKGKVTSPKRCYYAPAK